MRLTLHFDVNRQRITPDDVEWMRRFQRELVSTAASVAFLQFAARHDSALADYLGAGDGVTHADRLGLDAWDRQLARPTPGHPLEPVQTARDICDIAHRDEWMAARWAIKVQLSLLKAHTLTESAQTDEVTIVTRAALPPGVNELCHAILEQVIHACWFKPRESPFFDLFDSQDPMRQRVRDALDLRFTPGLIHDRLVQTVAFEVARLETVTFEYVYDWVDPERFARLTRATCDLDTELPHSDADIGIKRW